MKLFQLVIWLAASIGILSLAVLLLLAQARGYLCKSRKDKVIIYICILFFVFLAYAFYSQAWAGESEAINIWESLYFS